MTCQNNLKQIAIALHAYHETYGSFPPASVSDGNGRPAHSWRVLLLPYLEERALYEQYRFDEPWDGPHNRKLAERIPGCYRCPSHGHHGQATGPHVANYALVTSRAGEFHGTSARSLGDVDDPSATLLVVEVNEHSVHWLAPHDISTEELLACFDPPRDWNHPGGTNTATMDGSVRFLGNDSGRHTVAMLTGGGSGP